MGNGPYSPSAEQKLADLMNRDLGTAVSAREVRMFVKANWRILSAYAHTIHDPAAQEGCPKDGGTDAHP
jgi:hypothetical protein